MRKRNLVAMILAALMMFGVAVHAGTDTHSTTLSIGNAAPTIIGVGPIANVDLVAGSTKTVAINYSVQDTNGYEDIDTAELKVYVTKGGETDRINTSGDCETSGTGNLLEVTCNIEFQYYDGEGAWDINVTAKDDAGLYIDDETITVTLNALDDILFNDTAISCGTGLTSPSDDNKCDVLEIANRGNQDYTELNETAYNLDDDSTGTFVIDASQFAVDITDVATGDVMGDSAAVTITGGTLSSGAGVTEVLYTYVDVPTGKPADTYTATSDWSILAT